MCIFLLKISVYRRQFDEIRYMSFLKKDDAYMSFLKKDDALLENFNEIWKKVKNNIKKNSMVNLYAMKNN